ncbi:AAA family ATPase [Desulfogranum marinum]|uniref:AAA family ATPase n=1 Tax=Desulfogranum marinum TaxID=453220 RepID=UPI001964BC50|nr:ATP-binding protein [Desulfogranum marinum]MBM9511747.1 ATP-binding protein [Desulfogranum marinum]
MEKKVIVFFGMTASGKSTLAGTYAAANAIPYYNTDRMRKKLAGLLPTDKRPDAVGKGIYSADFTRKTYAAMLKQAAVDMEQGQSVVFLDGSYSNLEEREAVVEMAGQYDATPLFIYCTCSADEVRRRLQKRAVDETAVSDGRWEIYQHQLKAFVDPALGTGGRLVTLDTEQKLSALLKTVERLLAQE